MNQSRKDLTASEKMRIAGINDPLERRRSPVLLVVAGVVSTLLILGCCVCGAGLWWFRPQLREDPQHAERVLAEIVDISIPETFQPRGAIEWNVTLFVTLLKARGVYFERSVGDGLLAIVEINSGISDEQQIRRYIRDTMVSHGAGGMPLVVNSAETTRKSFEIRGEQVSFTFEVARDPPTGRVFRIVEGVFEGKAGQVLLSLRVEDGRWKEDEVIEMLNSIGKPPAAPPPLPTAPAGTHP